MPLDLGELESSIVLEAPGWDTPFRFALLGDFSGRHSQAAEEGPDEIARRKPRRIDRENFDDVMTSIAPTLTLKINDIDIELTFTSLDDFHPDQLIAKIDQFDDLDSTTEKSAFLSAILRHPQFQSLESSWRGIDWLLRRAWKADNGVEVLVYDLTWNEFVSCLLASNDLTQCPLFHLLVEKAMQGQNAQPWGVLVGNFYFDTTAEHAQLLGRMARIARQAAAPFLAGLAGKPWEKSYKPADAEAWAELRSLPEAQMLALSAPRFLLRLVYGSSTKPVEKFDYEEFTSTADHPHLLYGNAAFLVAGLMGMSFTKKNWQFKPGADLDLANMTMHVYTDDGDTESIVAEAWLVKPEIEKLGTLGIMAFLSVRGQNAVQLFRFQALAQPPKDKTHVDLVGSWGQKALKGVPRVSSKPGFTKVVVGDTTGGVSPSVPKGKPPEGESPLDALDASASEEISENEDVSEDDSSGDAPSEETPAEETPAEEAMDPELAAMLADLESPAEEESPDVAAEEAPAEDTMDPELAALLADLETPAEEAPAEEAPAEEEGTGESPAEVASEGGAENEETGNDVPLDPELAALLADLEQSAPAEPEPEPPAETEMDPELAALLADLESTTEGAESETLAEEATEEADLDALLKELEG